MRTGHVRALVCQSESPPKIDATFDTAVAALAEDDSRGLKPAAIKVAAAAELFSSSKAVARRETPSKIGTVAVVEMSWSEPALT